MADKMEVMLELERRGKLPPDKQGLLDEARKRGLVSPSSSTSAPTPTQQPPSMLETAWDKGIKPTIEYGGMVAGGVMGGTAGAVAGGPIGASLGAVGGAGLGYAAGKRITKAADVFAGRAEPERPVEAFKNTGTDIVKGAAYEAGGQAAGPILKGAKDIIGKGARKMYTSSLKPVPSLPAKQREQAISTGLNRAIEGKAYKPSEKHVYRTWEEVSNLVSQADDIVSKAAGKGDVISVKALSGAVDDVAARFNQGPFPKGDIKTLDALKKQLISKYGPNGTMPSSEALNMKKHIYQIAKKYYKNPNVAVAPVKIEAEKAVARAIKSELETLYPATKPLNETASELIDFGKVLERAANRTSNREIFSIFDIIGAGVGGTVGGPGGAVKGGLLSYTLTNPQFKAMLAKEMHRASIPAPVKEKLLTQFLSYGLMRYGEDKPYSELDDMLNNRHR